MCVMVTVLLLDCQLMISFRFYLRHVLINLENNFVFLNDYFFFYVYSVHVHVMKYGYIDGLILATNFKLLLIKRTNDIIVGAWQK